MPPRIALALMTIAQWDAWRLLAGRIDDTASGALIAALIAVLIWRIGRTDDTTVPAAQIAALLALYTVTTLTGPALLQIGVAVGSAVFIACRGALPRLPIIGLAMLALPILPTLDFLLAYPLRRVSAMLTVGLLRSNGVDVGLQGVALDWHGQLLLFDGPCSGVRMLWAALLLASLIAVARGFGPWRYARTLALAVTIAVAGNALRAASLFYLENGFIPRLSGPVAHEAVGIVAFALLALATIAVTLPRGRITA